jgi:putative membrane protein
MMHWYGTGWSWWAATLMWLGMIAFWAVVIWAVYALITSGSGRDGGEAVGQARRILDERLARGEIDPDEYRRRLDVMASSSDRATADGGGAR